MIVSVGRMMRKGGGGLIWPKGLKESIKAIYDPAKQGMTNYDVIEAYAEDFTGWEYRDYRGTAKITNNAIVITNVVETNNNIVEDAKEPYSDLTIRVTGVTEDKYLIVRQGRGKPEAHIKKDGIYTFKDNNLYFGFGVSVIGECNITITQLPTSILKDLSGNGNHAYLYGGKGKLNSGMGVYKFDFLSDLLINSAYLPYTERQYDSICSLAGHPNGWLFQYKSLTDIPAFKVEVKGIVNDRFIYRYYDENGNRGKDIIINKDGIYELPISYSVENNTGVGIVCNNICQDNVCFTQIPDYPDQLCYDGKMYAVCYGFPILTDYTVMAERTWFKIGNNSCFASKRIGANKGAFAIEYRKLYAENFGLYNAITFVANKKEIIVQSKEKYNDKDLIAGNEIDTNQLLIGGISLNNNRLNEPYIGCHGTIIVADRSFTEEEINWLKNNLFTIDIPTPAYDFDFSKYKDGSNLGDSITDKYGNVLELHNFAWKGMSGLGGYPIDLKATFPRNYTDGRDYICNDKEITCSYIGKSGLFQVLIVNQDITKYIEIPEFTIKISGSENIKLTYHYIKEDFTKGLLNIVGNGIYKIPKSYKADKIVENLNWLGFVLQNHIDENVDLKLEILPIYPGALVFDGIDDYARLAKMTIKTVVLDFVNLELDKQVYDNRDKPNNHNYFSIYPQADTVAYEARNSNGKTYINGELNTTIKTNDLLGVRCITCASNDLAKETEQYICRDSYLNNYYGKIALYRITGFTEMLTADQVWKWYQKNKAKGGDK